MTINYKLISYFCFFLAIAILTMAAVGVFVGNHNAIIYKALFVILLVASVGAHFLASRR